MEKPNFAQLYSETIRPELQKKLGLANIMAVPKVSKIVLNVGIKGITTDSRLMQKVLDALAAIAGQKPVKTRARKSLAGFKLREGLPIGAMVTLRGRNMYEFLYGFINLAVPAIRDFRGLSTKLDGRGNYNIGIKDCTIFPEVEYNVGDFSFGMNITIHTTAKSDEPARELMKAFGVPFEGKNK